jgi:hypothetical protein
MRYPGASTWKRAKCMKPSPSWEANSSSATQEIHSSLWNPKFHYHTLKSPPLVSILSHMNPVHTPQTISLRTILILPSHLSLSRSSYLYLPYRLSYINPLHTCVLHTSSISFSCVDHTNNIRCGVQVMKLLTVQFSPASFVSTVLHSDIPLSTLFLRTLSRLPPLVWGMKFRDNTKLDTKLYFCVS